MTLRYFAPAILAGVLFTATPAPACPFCTPTGTTLTGEVTQADLILFGTLQTAQCDPNDPTAFNKGSTELAIDLVIKPHDMVKGKKKITIPRYVPPDGKNTKYLVFLRIADGQLDPYRGVGVPAESKLPEYLQGAIAVRQKDIATRLRYFFDYLEDADIEVSSDAYNEFAVADYKELQQVASKLPPATLLKWLKDPNTRGSRFGLYGLLLGHCGKSEDAKAIRALLDDKDRAYTSGLDGIVTGYVLLNPKAGWDYLVGLIQDKDKEFPIKYAALKTVRFFWDMRGDTIPKTRVLDAMKMLMDDPDIADMPIEDIRKWKVWELTPIVLGYATKASHNGTPITMRAVLKFAIVAAWSDPKNTAAADFVKAARAKDAKRVQFLEEVLKDEMKPALAATTPSSTPKPGG